MPEFYIWALLKFQNQSAMLYHESTEWKAVAYGPYDGANLNNLPTGIVIDLKLYNFFTKANER